MITYETIEEKIKEENLYDPRYHMIGNEFFTDEEIEDMEVYPKKKRYYHTVEEILLDFITIEDAYRRLNANLFNMDEDFFQTIERFASLEVVLSMQTKNVGSVRRILNEEESKNIPIEPEAKHLFKNMKFF